MRSPRTRLAARIFAGTVATLFMTHLAPWRAEAGAKLFETDDFSVELGMRMQPRMELVRLTSSNGQDETRRDLLIRRSRLKLNGKIQTATYNFEWKTDGADQGTLVTPTTQVENAYIQYPVGGGVEVRAGLYDQPFSRDRLTSDSKQLAVDRGEVSNVPDALGLADNVVGLQVQGKVRGGRAAYAVGAFDNRMIPGKDQDTPMVVGRLDLNFGAAKDVFWDAHFGTDSWCSIGVDGSYQGSLENIATDVTSNAAAGIDGMIDVPVGAGHLLAVAELNGIKAERRGAADAIETTVWMVGAGFLINQRLQPIVRFDRVRRDREDPLFLADPLRRVIRDITFVGANFYQKGHTFKIQGDVRMESGTNQAVDGVRLQAQIDY